MLHQLTIINLVRKTAKNENWIFFEIFWIFTEFQIGHNDIKWWIT